MNIAHYLPVPVAHSQCYSNLKTEVAPGAAFQGASDGAFVTRRRGNFNERKEENLFFPALSSSPTQRPRPRHLPSRRNGAFVQELLLKELKKFCRDAATGSAGKIASTTAAMAEVSTQSAVMVTHYSLQCRVDFLLQTHLPSLTRDLVDAVDAALRRA